MSNAEELLADTQKLFRELRGAWFRERLTGLRREVRVEYNKQTERLLQGEPLPVAPRWPKDLDT